LNCFFFGGTTIGEWTGASDGGTMRERPAPSAGAGEKVCCMRGSGRTFAGSARSGGIRDAVCRSGGGIRMPEGGMPNVPSPACAITGARMTKAANARRPTRRIISIVPAANSGECGSFMVNEA
jgi:hypothetical protein